MFGERLLGWYWEMPNTEVVSRTGLRKETGFLDMIPLADLDRVGCTGFGHFLLGQHRVQQLEDRQACRES